MAKILIASAAILTAVLASAPRAGACDLWGQVGYPYACVPPVVVAPGFVYQPYLPVYPYPPVYYAPPLGTFDSWWDPDYRAIRYNRYFQRYQDRPRIQGFTLR